MEIPTPTRIFRDADLKVDHAIFPLEKLYYFRKTEKWYEVTFKKDLTRYGRYAIVGGDIYACVSYKSYKHIQRQHV